MGKRNKYQLRDINNCECLDFLDTRIRVFGKKKLNRAYCFMEKKFLTICLTIIFVSAASIALLVRFGLMGVDITSAHGGKKLGPFIEGDSDNLQVTSASMEAQIGSEDDSSTSDQGSVQKSTSGINSDYTSDTKKEKDSYTNSSQGSSPSISPPVPDSPNIPNTPMPSSSEQPQPNPQDDQSEQTCPPISPFPIEWGFDVLCKGDLSRIDYQKNYVIKSNSEYQNMLNESWVSCPLEDINFSSYMVVAVFMGEKNTGGYSIQVKRVIEYIDRYVIEIERTYPRDGDIRIMWISHPFQVIRTKSTDKPVTFKYIS